MPPVIHWPVSQPPRAIVTARNTITSTRPAAKASLASVADRIIAVRAAAETNGDRTRSRRSAMMIRGPWARYAPTRTSHTAALRTLSTSGTACGIPSTGTAACQASASPARPKAMANRFGGTRVPRNLRRFGLWSPATIRGVGIRPPKVAAQCCACEERQRAAPARSRRRTFGRRQVIAGGSGNETRYREVLAGRDDADVGMKEQEGHDSLAGGGGGTGPRVWKRGERVPATAQCR